MTRLLVVLYFVISCSFEASTSVAKDADASGDGLEISHIQEYMKMVEKELATLRQRVEQLTIENEQLSKSMLVIQSVSKKALYEKWVELISTEEMHREDENFELDEDPEMFLEMAANAGHDMAQLEMGLVYAHGSPTVNQSYQMAAKYYTLAARQGNTIAECYLAILYHTGRGVEKNINEAARLYRLAAGKGHSTAQNNLGWLLLTSGGKDWIQSLKNEKEAVKWFYEGVTKNDAFSRANLALCLVIGAGGLEINTEVALKLYKSIDGEDIVRYAEVALDETPVWRRKMMKLFQLAAEDGDQYAMVVLATYRERHGEILHIDDDGSVDQHVSEHPEKTKGNKLLSRSEAM